VDEDILRKLEERLGPLYARQRLGIETDREAQIFGQGLLFFHIGNWYPVRSVIRNALKLTGLYWRARRNTERILVKRSQSRRRRRPLTTPSCWTEARLQAVIAIGPIAVMKRACIMRAIRSLICFAPGNLGRRREATLIHPVTHWSEVCQRCSLRAAWTIRG